MDRIDAILLGAFTLALAAAIGATVLWQERAEAARDRRYREAMARGDWAEVDRLIKGGSSDE